VTVADVNGDGQPDLIVANQGDGTVSELLKQHRPGRHHTELRRPADLCHGKRAFLGDGADVTGDGKPDLIVANLGGNTVSVLLNTTAPGAMTASFATQQTWSQSRPRLSSRLPVSAQQGLDRDALPEDSAPKCGLISPSKSLF
jgi:hypothetical protein